MHPIHLWGNDGGESAKIKLENFLYTNHSDILEQNYFFHDLYLYYNIDSCDLGVVEQFIECERKTLGFSHGDESKRC